MTWIVLILQTTATLCRAISCCECGWKRHKRASGRSVRVMAVTIATVFNENNKYVSNISLFQIHPVNISIISKYNQDKSGQEEGEEKTLAVLDIHSVKSDVSFTRSLFLALVIQWNWKSSASCWLTAQTWAASWPSSCCSTLRWNSRTRLASSLRSMKATRLHDAGTYRVCGHWVRKRTSCWSSGRWCRPSRSWWGLEGPW